MADCNLLNDSSDFIYEFFQCYKEDREKLSQMIEETPIYGKILKGKGLNDFDRSARKALALCTSFLGGGDTIRLDKQNAKQFLIKNIADKIFEKIRFAVFDNRDCLAFLKAISKDVVNENTFIYCDPPYLVSKGRLMENRGWNEDKLRALLDFLMIKPWKFAMSEFDDDKVLRIFEEYGLNVVFLSESSGASKSMGKGRVKAEILAMNYNIEQEDIFSNISLKS